MAKTTIKLFKKNSTLVSYEKHAKKMNKLMGVKHSVKKNDIEKSLNKFESKSLKVFKLSSIFAKLSFKFN